MIPPKKPVVMTVKNYQIKKHTCLTKLKASTTWFHVEFSLVKFNIITDHLPDTAPTAIFW